VYMGQLQVVSYARHTDRASRFDFRVL
jgi:hypothetical protein